jgi:hypothetical protein
LIHARPLLRIVGGELGGLEHLIDIAGDRGRLIKHEIAMAKDWHPVKRVQREMRGRAHLRFEVVEGVGHLFLGQDEARHLDVNAAGKAE